MNKKDRPMLSVTSLLYNLPSPNINGANSFTFQDSSPSAATAAAAAHSSNYSHKSPLNVQTNLATINGHNNSNSPTGSQIVSSCDNSSFPPNHPLSGSKHLCAICEDRASGKHYGVFSCEGCKGFFKRTVRKDLTYVCRDEKNCIVDKRQRNRCQFCRYQKCLDMGMKREAVQEERQRNKPTNENEPESSTTTLNNNGNNNNNNISSNDQFIYFSELNIERLTEAEKSIEIIPGQCLMSTRIATKEIELLFQWVKHIPYFNTLHCSDQVTLLKSSWNELLIAEFSYRSTNKNDCLVLANSVTVSKQNAQIAGIGDIFGRVLDELVAKMREMQMDQSEIGCLRAIVLFNPAIKNLKSSGNVEKLRDRVYSVLENHCRTSYHNKTSRFAKLLVRLPALRSIGLKCVEHLFFQQFLQENNGQNSIESFIIQMLGLDSPNRYPINTTINHNTNSYLM